ncbi:MAG TPA: ATP-binding protein [Candidatus Sphingobacterium stercoripullorum]|uniref:histidine kinase n=1 Tax=Candidatus Sphingobacterium stercoripullorum TaxID=2838759 RepID=A0A9D1W922_9SPHI|nr:ATP-binding protein [Candidatus Sphingobacterium stercoripullorum]
MLNRIRILLLILTLSFIGTAITIRISIKDENILELDTHTLNKNIHKAEKSINKLFRDSAALKTLKDTDLNPTNTSLLADDFSSRHGVYLYVYKNNRPIYWGTNIFVPQVEESDLRNPINFIQSEKRTAISKRIKLSDEITVLALIPIRSSYDSNNEYLVSRFNKKLLSNNNLDIAEYTDTELIRNIYSLDGHYLFSVKLVQGKLVTLYDYLQILFYVLSILTLLSLGHSLCYELARKKAPWLSIVCFIALLFTIIILDRTASWVPSNTSIGIFDPKYYAYNQFFPDLWSVLTTYIYILWLMIYVHTTLPLISLEGKVRSQVIKIVIAIISFSSIYVLAYLISNHIGTIVINSGYIGNYFTQILNLKWHVWVGLVIFSIVCVSLVLYIDTIIYLTKQLIGNIQSINVQLILVILATITTIAIDESPILYLFLGLIILVRYFSKPTSKVQSEFPVFITTLVLLTFLSVLTYNKFLSIKTEENMKLALAQLEAEDDINALSLFREMEQQITQDDQLKYLFQISLPYTDPKVISQYIKNKYLSGYLSKYDFNGYYYLNEQPFENYNQDWITHFREQVISGSSKISGTSGFYRTGRELGMHEYFAIIDIPMPNDQTIYLYLNFENKAFSTTIPYPEPLIDSRFDIWNQEIYENSSFALYKNGRLLTQNGDYVYPSTLEYIKHKTNHFTSYEDDTGHHHVTYSPDSRTTLIISKPLSKLWEYVAMSSFLFVILYLVFSIFNLFKYILMTISENAFKYRSIKYHFFLLLNTIQYSTRIQTMLIGLVIFAIMLSGLIAFISISKQLDTTKQLSKLKNISILARKVENKIRNLSPDEIFEGKETPIGILDDIALEDYILYDRNGKLLYTSQPRIFDLKLLSNFMNPKAYNQLHVIKKSEVLEKDQIGEFRFDAVYATIRNNNYQTVAYLSVPSFSSKKEEDMNNNLLLNTILNIYTVVIIAFGFLAIFISNKITRPLSLIQRKLAQTQFSENQPNEPLFWARNDEIGTVIKEYNYMLIKLEESTKRLRNAEREAAWREMARQVAHEIKNPLTPMKLGVQQLERSFNERDPRFEERFQKFSKTFIAQIDSLARIASEFSAFAKLPDTQLSKINLLDKIGKSINLYQNSGISGIALLNRTGLDNLFVLGDKDQLLRAFNNLIKNSIEAAVIKKRHRIQILLHTFDKGKMLRLQIKDNGHGIPPEAIPNIFRPNFTTKSSGTGLGLAFVKQTIDTMNGKISFKTSPNGTNFILEVPLYITDA